MSRFAVFGRNFSFISSEPKWAMTGPIMLALNASGGGTQASCISSCQMCFCSGVQSWPPHSTGQLGTAMPASFMIRCEVTMSSFETCRPAAIVSRISWGILVVKKVRISSRKAVSSSVSASCIGAPVRTRCWPRYRAVQRARRAPGTGPGGSGCERLFDVGGDLLRRRRGAVALDHGAVLADQELGEVPLDLVAEDAALLLPQPGEQRVRVVAVDVDLLEHREADAVVALAERADLVVAAGVLAAELVAGEAQHDQALVGVLLVELLQPLELGREATLGGRVDHERHLARVGREGLLLTGDRGGAEVAQGRHAGLLLGRRCRSGCRLQRRGASFVPAARCAVPYRRVALTRHVCAGPDRGVFARTTATELSCLRSKETSRRRLPAELRVSIVWVTRPL